MAVSQLDRIIEQYHAALDEFVNGSPTSLQKLFSHRDDVSLANPVAPLARGWKEVSETQARASSQFQESEPTHFERLVTCVTPELAFIVEMERLRGKLDSVEKARPIALRVTTIFRPEGGTWKVVHRHADSITSPRPLESILQQ
jgi:ketosteroid isomerase-like protein